MKRDKRKDDAYNDLQDWAYWYAKNVLRCYPKSTPTANAGQGAAATDEGHKPPKVMMRDHIAKTDRIVRNMDRLHKFVVETEYLYFSTDTEKLIFFIGMTRRKESEYQKLLDECLDIVAKGAE